MLDTDQDYQATNTEYGGLDIAVSNVVFVHGSIDPWHAMGVIQSNRTEAPAIYIEGEIKILIKCDHHLSSLPGTAHCANMYPASASDPPQLTEARTKIGQLIKKWVGQ